MTDTLRPDAVLALNRELFIVTEKVVHLTRAGIKKPVRAF